MKLLIVDDEPRWRDRIKKLAESFGFIVKTVSSGNQALDELRVDQFDIVITDVRMSDGDGIAVLQGIFWAAIGETRVFVHSSEASYHFDGDVIDLATFVRVFFGGFAQFALKNDPDKLAAFLRANSPQAS